jgi:peptide-methionine (R)-S-oxide reductase
MDTDKEELKKKLTPEEYHVTQEKGTEAPFSGAYVHTKENGTYNCKVCGTPLFSSDTKFDSGTGWPSFDKALPGAVKENVDDSHGMTRTEIVCATCGAHLGHKFSDGPKDTTGDRFCMNSCALDLEKK